MMKSILSFSSAGLAVLLSFAMTAGPLEAQSQRVKATQTPRALPKSGSLSRSVSAGYQSKVVAEPWGGTDPRGEDLAPITGSVFRSGPRDWKMTVVNNSETDTYSVSVEVVQYGERDNRLKTDNFSYTLKPKEGAERTVSGYANTRDAALNLRNWRKIGGVRQEPTAAPTIDSLAGGRGTASEIEYPDGTSTLAPGIPVTIKE